MSASMWEEMEALTVTLRYLKYTTGDIHQDGNYLFYY